MRSDVADKIRKQLETYGRQYEVYVYLGICDRCSLAPLARENLVQPHNPSDIFAKLKSVASLSNIEHKRDWF